MPRNLRPGVRTGLLVAALTLTTVVSAACQGGPAVAGSASDQQVTIKAFDTMRFDPPTITVPAGQPVQVTLANEGTLVHDLVLSAGADQPVKIEAGGKTAPSATFTIARPGTYVYICAQPGHEAAGMKGTIVAR